MLVGDDARISGGKLPEQCGNVGFESSEGVKFIGESINEDTIVSGLEESARLSFKGDYEEKDGFPACRLAA